MTVEELFEELRQLHRAAATAPLTFIAKLPADSGKDEKFAFGVTRVHYEQGVVVLDIEQTAPAWGPEAKVPSALPVAVRRDIQRARRQLAKARRGHGKVLPHRTGREEC